jgi:hypothetical protein
MPNSCPCLQAAVCAAGTLANLAAAAGGANTMGSLAQALAGALAGGAVYHSVNFDNERLT